ncbi:MAG: hypothetical protein JNL58_13225 [Planctomyces sp.]|nr:hypothetical protein [Planctomyces sp.]
MITLQSRYRGLQNILIAFTTACFSCLSLQQLLAESPSETRVRIVVHVPTEAVSAPDEAAGSPAETVIHPPKPPRIYLAGNLRALGQWKPNGLLLTRATDGTYQGEFLAPAGSQVECKITQGSWQQVEKNSQGLDIPNRRLAIEPAVNEAVQEFRVSVEGWAKPTTGKSTVTGSLVLHEELASEFLPAKRTVAVWLPPGYDQNTDRYPVLYMHDGQNLFDSATAAFGTEWQADETASRLIAQQEICPLIIVGIWNTPDRIDEYTVSRDAQSERGGNGLNYIRFLADELKPMIDRNYRTLTNRDSTVTGGSSLGGLISIHACIHRPDIFGGCAAISPSLGWADERILTELSTETRLPIEARIWLSMGAREGRDESTRTAAVDRCRRLHELLTSADQKSDRNILFLEAKEGTHDERAWSRQLPDALRFLFPPLTPDKAE